MRRKEIKKERDEKGRRKVKRKIKREWHMGPINDMCALHVTIADGVKILSI